MRLRSIPRLLAGMTAFVLAAGCREAPTLFTCHADEGCVDGDRKGRCLADPLGHFCAFPDLDCPGNLRWDRSSAPALAGTCVTPPDAGVNDGNPGDLGFGGGSDGATGDARAPDMEVCEPQFYPCGAYGTTIGATIADLEFVGQRDDNHNGTVVDDPVRSIRFDDYYRDKNVKVLAVIASAEWCVSCKLLEPELINSWKSYQAGNRGVAYLEVVVQDAKGNPADIADVDEWAGTNWSGAGPIPFDVAADPTLALAPYYDLAAFPMQMLIRTDDMSIQWQENGYAPGALESAIDELLKQ